MTRFRPKRWLVGLLLGSIVGASGCGGASETAPPVDRGKDPDLQKAMGNYMNNVNKPADKKK